VKVHLNRLSYGQPENVFEKKSVETTPTSEKNMLKYVRKNELKTFLESILTPTSVTVNEYYL
jgi:hypothetical protein